MDSDRVDSASVDISDFIKSKKDIIIVSDVEGFCPEKQIAKIVDYASGKDQSKGVIFNGDIFDYTVVGAGLDNADKNNLCALKLLKALTDGMKAGNVICNIGNRDINKIKLLALLQAEDNSAWWESGETGKSIPEIATNLLNKYNKNPEKFWKFNDLRSINPFWNKSNSNFTNEKWLPGKPVIAKSLLERFEYIFGDDPAKGTMSAKNNLNGIPLELGINIDTLNDEAKAAIVFTVFARMLFMNPAAPRQLDQDGLLREYLTLANATSYAIIDQTLLLFAHGGFTQKFFDNKDIIGNLRDNLRTNSADINKEIMEPKPASLQLQSKTQTGGSFESKMNQIETFSAHIKFIIKKIFEGNPGTNEYIHIGQNDIPFLNTDLMILTILSTPATNNKIIAGLVSPYETALSPIQVGSPINQPLYNSIEAGLEKSPDKGMEENNVSKVINIFSHVPKGFGYSFGKSGYNSYFINTDFSNTLLKNRKYLNPIETNPSYLILHLENPEPSTSNRSKKWHFRLDGMIDMDISGFVKSTVSTYELIGINKLSVDELKMMQKDTILTDSKLTLDDLTKLRLTFNQSFSFTQLKINAYPTQNLFYHGIASINDSASYKVYSVNGIAPPFAKHLYLMSLHLESVKISLSNKGIKGGSHRQTKRNKSRKIIRKLVGKIVSKKLNTRTQSK